MIEMTLATYLAQENPVYMPKVLLEPDEVEIGITIPGRCNGLGQKTFITEVTVKAYSQYSYAIVDNETRLKGLDEHGNPKSPTCFHLKQPIDQAKLYEQQQAKAKENLRQMGY